jgi:site-specific DNA recombinase
MASVDDEIDRLDGPSAFEPRTSWRRQWKQPPQMRLSRDMLIRCLAWKLQESALRGIGKPELRKFRAAAKSKADGNFGQPIIRIPASAIESPVTDRYLMQLRSQTDLSELFQPLNLSASQLREVIQKVQEGARTGNSKSAADQRATLQAVLVKDRLQSDHAELCLSRRGPLQSILRPTPPDASPTDSSTEHPSFNYEDDVAFIQTANCLAPSGNGLRLMINVTNQAAPNMHLAPRLGEAFTLRETLLNGPHDSIEAISKALQLGKGHINARIRLTFLSPNLIRRLLNGDVPITLSPTRLLKASKDLPVKWAEQDCFIEALAR